MIDNGKFLVDVGIRGLPFPIKVVSRVDPNGQLQLQIFLPMHTLCMNSKHDGLINLSK